MNPQNNVNTMLQNTLRELVDELKIMNNNIRYMFKDRKKNQNPKKQAQGSKLAAEVRQWTDGKLFSQLHKAKQKEWWHLFRIVSAELDDRGLLDDDEEWDGDFEAHPMQRKKGDLGAFNGDLKFKNIEK